MVRLSLWQAERRQPVAAHDPPKPFVPPPAPPKTTVAVPEPPAEQAPARPAAPALPQVELPPFHPAKK